MIRVFNQDFIKENVFTLSNEVNPIFFLGTEDIAKQKEIEKLKTILSELKDKESTLVPELELKERLLHKICKDEAKRIKDFLRTNRENKYSYYDTPKYKDKCDSLKDENFQQKILNESELLHLKNSIDSPLMDPIPKISLSLNNLETIRTNVEKKIRDTITSALISRLTNDAELNSWVWKGLGLLKSSNATTCPFCEHPIDSDFIEKLEGHFDDQYNRYIAEIDVLIKEIQNYHRILTIKLPSKNDFYSEFSDDYEYNKKLLEQDLEKLSDYLIIIIKILEEKKKSPFKNNLIIPEQPVHNTIKEIDTINGLIERHNLKTQNFLEIVETNSQIVEESFIAEKMEDYITLNTEITKLRLC